MTYEEALKRLRYEIEEEGHCSFIEDEMEFAFEALEKQIPKAVEVATFEHPMRKKYYPPRYYCPVCRKQQKNSFKNKDKGCYCERCGQALKWRDEL